MKLTTCFLGLIFVFHFTTLAQKNSGLPQVSPVEKSDLLMTDCDFEKGAEACKLIDIGSVEWQGASPGLIYFATRYTRLTRIKIFKEKGLSYANVVIPFLSIDDYEKIDDLVAYTYNLDDAGNIKTTKVSKSSIYKKAVNSSYSKMIITFPEVKPGSIIEYAYSLKRGLSYSIDDWRFQDKIPVRFSAYTMAMPTYLHFKVQPFVSENMETKQQESKSLFTYNPSTDAHENTVIKNYSMSNIKGLQSEPYMGSENDYLQQVKFLLTQVEVYGNDIIDLSTSWSLFVEYAEKSKYFGEQIEAFLGKTLRLVDEWKAIPDQKTRIKTIFKHVQQRVTNTDPEGIYSYDGVETAYNESKGSTADINLLLINLLIKSDVKAIPILFSTRDNGLVNTSYPDINQFNKVMAYVPVDDKYWVLDASDKLASCTVIPPAVVNSNGFLLQKPGGRWVEVLENKVKYKVFAAVKADISADGKMTGDVTINCSGYAKNDRATTWIKSKEEFKEKYFQIPDVSMNLEDISVNNVYADSVPLEQKAKFTCALNNSGPYAYFTANICTGFHKNQFIADQRVSDIDFGYLQDYIMVGSFSIPEGYTFDALPGNVSLTMPDNSIVFTRVMVANENQLNVRMTIEFKNSFYAATDYPDFREFHKKMFAALNEQIVMKKK